MADSGRTKTDDGEGRAIPLTLAWLPALKEQVEWYNNDRFWEIRLNWFFPFGSRPSNPTRYVATLKTAWTKIRDNALSSFWRMLTCNLKTAQPRRYDGAVLPVSRDNMS